jgi:hypothetical protein
LTAIQCTTYLAKGTPKTGNRPQLRLEGAIESGLSIAERNTKAAKRGQKKLKSKKGTLSDQN